MCGIFAHLLIDSYWNQAEKKKIDNCFQKIKHRGPDCTNSIYINNYFLGFHRLKINDLSNKGNQPFNISEIDPNLYLICNGENI